MTVETLIDEITASCRLDEPDPVQSWREHLAALALRAEGLNRLNIDSIRIHGSGSDLRVELLPGSRWRTSLTRTAWGQTHCVNLPPGHTAVHRLRLRDPRRSTPVRKRPRR